MTPRSNRRRLVGSADDRPDFSPPADEYIALALLGSSARLAHDKSKQQIDRQADGVDVARRPRLQPAAVTTWKKQGPGHGG